MVAEIRAVLMYSGGHTGDNNISRVNYKEHFSDCSKNVRRSCVCCYEDGCGSSDSSVREVFILVRVFSEE